MAQFNSVTYLNAATPYFMLGHPQVIDLSGIVLSDQNGVLAVDGVPIMPSNWSNYSTLNSTIAFNISSATLVAEASASTPSLLFNGNVLAYQSEIPNLKNWAMYAANNPVEISSFNISNIGNLTCSVGNFSTINVSTTAPLISTFSTLTVAKLIPSTITVANTTVTGTGIIFSTNVTFTSSITGIDGLSTGTDGLIYVSSLITNDISVKNDFQLRPLDGTNFSLNMSLGNSIGTAASWVGYSILAGATTIAGVESLTTGAVAMYNGRGANYLTADGNPELVNTTTQLQVSTLGTSFSTIERLISSGQEVFISTINPAGSAIRSFSDPLQTISTGNTSYVQAFGQWSPLPTQGSLSSISNGGAFVNIDAAGIISLNNSNSINAQSTIINSSGTILLTSANSNVELYASNNAPTSIILDQGEQNIYVTTTNSAGIGQGNIYLNNTVTQLAIGSSVDSPPATGLFFDTTRLIFNGVSVIGTNGYIYRADNGTTPTSGLITWNVFANQITSTAIRIDYITNGGAIIKDLLNTLVIGSSFILQDTTGINYQTWQINGTPIPNNILGYIEYPVILLASGGTPQFINGTLIDLILGGGSSAGPTGPTGPTGYGATGPTSSTGPTGFSSTGPTGYGATGPTGTVTSWITGGTDTQDSVTITTVNINVPINTGASAIVASGTSRYFISGQVGYTAGAGINPVVSWTLARSTALPATTANSTNLASGGGLLNANLINTNPYRLGSILTPATYASTCPVSIVDKPPAGSWFYSLFAQSTAVNGTTAENIVITVLQVSQ